MLYVWGVAGLLGGDVLLRIEDHDRQRCRPEYEAGIVEDLEWLGFKPLNLPLPRGKWKYRQSDCDVCYVDALAALAARGLTYRCVCTRKTLQGMASLGPHGERVYPGTCRDARHPATVTHGIRLQWESGAEPERFFDGLHGMQRQSPERQCGDLLLKDRLGHWTYQFAVTVDDLRQGIDFVVRGNDLLASTGRQRRLARMLGGTAPLLYVHHPLVRDAEGVKLSKRQRPATMRELRLGGASPEAVLGEAALAAGLQTRARCLQASDAASLVVRRHHRLGQIPQGTLSQIRQG